MLIFPNVNLKNTKLDSKLTFEEHYKTVLRKIGLVGLLRKLQTFLPREALITIYKDFVKPHSITVMLPLIKHLTLPLMKKYNSYNTMLALLKAEQ